MSRVQIRTLREIAAGTYRPLAKEWMVRKSLIERGLINHHEGMFPRVYFLTNAGRMMLVS